MELITILVAGLAIFLGTLWLQRYQKKQKIAEIVDKIPGPANYPLVGTAWQFLGVPREKIFNVNLENTKTYPKIHRRWVAGQPEVRLYKPEFVEKIMSSTKHMEKSYIYDFVKPWLGEGLLILKGEKMHSHRKAITPTFHFSILDGFCDVFAEQSEVLIKKLENYAGTGQVLDICPYVTKCALDIICETAMGTKINAQGKTSNEYVDAIYDLNELILKRLIRPWLHPDCIYKWTQDGKQWNQALKIVHGFTSSVIEKRQHLRESLKSQKTAVSMPENEEDTGKKKRKAFLDLLLDASENGKNFTTEDLRAEVDTFMFAGHDTTTAGITWTLFCVGNHPDVQEKIAEEMESIFGDSDRPATINDMNEMKYLERVIKETLRLFPSVPLIGRVASEDVEIGGYVIPKDTPIAIQIFSILRDPEHYPNPTKFDPDRFLPEVTSKRHPYAYIPFSAGPRNCIGQKFAILEEKAVVSAFLRNYKVTSVDKPEDIQLMMELILRSSTGVKLQLEKRRK